MISAALPSASRASRLRTGRALEKLPTSEALLLARTAAIAALAAERDGEVELYRSYLSEAVQRDPSVIRRLGMSIPVQIDAGSSDIAQRVAELLEDSPRVHLEGGGFRIAIDGDKPNVKVCLHSPEQAQLNCAQAPRLKPAKGSEAEEEPDASYAARVAEAFHTQALAMPLGLSAADLASLDSSTTVAEQAARDKMDKLLENAVKDDK